LNFDIFTPTHPFRLLRSWVVLQHCLAAQFIAQSVPELSGAYSIPPDFMPGMEMTPKFFFPSTRISITVGN
jgi:hypothetical protein